ncbi:hypothetical protein CLF_103742 [Clonorchis sinensis]|uniref:Uncharacterized protein n=1 Tax=Clonorchis sinensis TaxID=79923 RepID=G7YAA4_CLOSI|nr:hypothetical protein CLF_103742 [Clonorchis sinensis]
MITNSAEIASERPPSLRISRVGYHETLKQPISKDLRRSGVQLNVLHKRLHTNEYFVESSEIWIQVEHKVDCAYLVSPKKDGDCRGLSKSLQQHCASAETERITKEVADTTRVRATTNERAHCTVGTTTFRMKSPGRPKSVTVRINGKPVILHTGSDSTDHETNVESEYDNQGLNRVFGCWWRCGQFDSKAAQRKGHVRTWGKHDRVNDEYDERSVSTVYQVNERLRLYHVPNPQTSRLR